MESLEAGNVATVFAVPDNADPDEPCSLVPAGGQGADVVTDAQGFARVCVIYPRSVNVWADVELTAQLNVFGSEFSESQQFQLLALASDLKDELTEPAGRISPFGTADELRKSELIGAVKTSEKPAAGRLFFAV